MDNALIVANIALVIITGFLVYVTRTYTYQTRRMADIMQKDYELRINHHYTIKYKIEDNTSDMLGGFVRIENIGMNTIYVRKPEIMILSIKNNSLKKGYKIKDVGIEVLHPEGQRKSFHYFRILKSDIAIEQYLKAEKFFGVVCNVIFRVEIAGPDQEYERKSVNII